MRISDWSSDVCSSDLPASISAGYRRLRQAGGPQKGWQMSKLTALSQEIWDMKYRLKGASGEPVDKTIADSWRRIARALAAAETEAETRQSVASRFFGPREDFGFLPARPLPAGPGRRGP